MLRDLLADGRVHVVDGAMGTMLYGRGVFLNVCYDELNLRQPDLVRDIHREYVRAGAELLETNTFGANPLKLATHGLAGETERINAAAAALAREAAGDARRRRSARSGRSACGSSRSASCRWTRPGRPSQRQVRGLLDGGVDGFILETFSDVAELGAAMQRCAADATCPIIAQMTVGTDGKTHYGTDPAVFGPELAAMGADVIGVNCSVGPAWRARGGREAGAGGAALPIAAQPNAGLPREVGDRKIYMAVPEYMASYARRMVEAGARFVGGCCGTTPDHIRAIVGLRAERLAAARGPVARGAATRARRVEPVPLAERSRLGAQARARASSSPRSRSCRREGVDPAPMFEQVRQLKAAGVDAVNVPDGPRAQSRMGALLSALHDPARGRARSGGALRLPRPQPARHALGPAGRGGRGHPQPAASSPAIRRRWGPIPRPPRSSTSTASDSPTSWRGSTAGSIPAAIRSATPTQFVIGVGVNPAAPDLERELKRFAWKVEAGAEYAITQPVFDLEQLDRFLKRVEGFSIPIIAGIWPLVSLRNAEFLANEVPGIRCRTRFWSGCGWRVRRQGGGAGRRGAHLPGRCWSRSRERVQGAQVSAPLGRVPVALDVLAAKAQPRPLKLGDVSGILLAGTGRPLRIAELLHAGPPHHAPAAHDSVRRRNDVPGRGPRVRRDRGAAARLGDGRGGAVPAGPRSRSSSSWASWASRCRSSSAAPAAAIFMAVLAIEELARVDASAAIYVDVHNTLVNNALLRWGNDEQQARYFPRLTTGLLGAFALSEPGSGSDAFALATRAERKGDRWELTGRKFWITNGAEAGVFIVFANTDFSKGYKGITAFIVERDFPGFAVGKKENKLGIRASSTTELILEQCRVPDANVLGPVGQGYKIAIETLNEGRIGIGAQMIGVAARRARGGHGVREGTAAVRQGDRGVPGRPVPARPDGHRPRGGPAHGVQRGPAQGRRASRSRSRRRWPSCSARRWPTAPRRSASSCSAATGTRRSIRRRSTTATRRSGRSTRARATCSCRRSPSRCSARLRLCRSRKRPGAGRCRRPICSIPYPNHSDRHQATDLSRGRQPYGAGASTHSDPPHPSPPTDALRCASLRLARPKDREYGSGLELADRSAGVFTRPWNPGAGSFVVSAAAR